MKISQSIALLLSTWVLSQNSFAAVLCKSTDKYSPNVGACEQLATGMKWWTEGTTVQMTYDAAANICSEQKMRLPTVAEMIQLYSDQAEKSFRVNLDDIFWVADAVANQGAHGAIYFSDTQKLSLANDKTAAVMCVLGIKKPQQRGTSWADVTTTDGTTSSSCGATPDNCTIQDDITGLKWTKELPETSWRPEKSWFQAITACNTLTYNGQKAGSWRLPTKDELLVAHSHNIRRAQKALWPDSSYSVYVWSSTESPSNGSEEALKVEMGSGFVMAQDCAIREKVLCVQE
jgi:hypothetical protein